MGFMDTTRKEGYPLSTKESPVTHFSRSIVQRTEERYVKTFRPREEPFSPLGLRNHPNEGMELRVCDFEEKDGKKVRNQQSLRGF